MPQKATGHHLVKENDTTLEVYTYPSHNVISPRGLRVQISEPPKWPALKPYLKSGALFYRRSQEREKQTWYWDEEANDWAPGENGLKHPTVQNLRLSTVNKPAWVSRKPASRKKSQGRKSSTGRSNRNRGGDASSTQEDGGDTASASEEEEEDAAASSSTVQTQQQQASKEPSVDPSRKRVSFEDDDSLADADEVFEAIMNESLTPEPPERSAGLSANGDDDDESGDEGSNEQSFSAERRALREIPSKAKHVRKNRDLFVRPELVKAWTAYRELPFELATCDAVFEIFRSLDAVKGELTALPLIASPVVWTPRVQFVLSALRVPPVITCWDCNFGHFDDKVEFAALLATLISSKHDDDITRLLVGFDLPCSFPKEVCLPQNLIFSSLTAFATDAQDQLRCFALVSPPGGFIELRYNVCARTSFQVVDGKAMLLTWPPTNKNRTWWFNRAAAPRDRKMQSKDTLKAIRGLSEMRVNYLEAGDTVFLPPMTIHSIIFFTNTTVLTTRSVHVDDIDHTIDLIQWIRRVNLHKWLREEAREDLRYILTGVAELWHMVAARNVAFKDQIEFLLTERLYPVYGSICEHLNYQYMARNIGNDTAEASAAP